MHIKWLNTPLCLSGARHWLLLMLIMPLLGSALSAAPTIQHWQTEDGMRVYYVPIKQLPMLDVQLTFDAGSARDADNTKWGLASLVADMLSEGSKGLSAEAIAQQFESLGANYSSGVSRDKASISLRSVTVDNAHKEALAVFEKVLSAPLFADKELSRLKKQYKVGFEAAKQRPNAIANRAFYKHLYQDHPYAHPVGGDEKTIDNISSDDLQRFYKRHYSQRNGQVVLVGDIEKSEAESIANALAAIFPQGDALPKLPKPQALKEAKTVKIEFDSAQSTVIMGQLGNYRGDPDYFSMYLANHPLGGSGFSARLMKEIRVKRGLSYGIYSYFAPLRQNGPFMLSFQTKKSSEAEAMQTVQKLVSEYAKLGPTAEELKASKQNIEGGFALRSSSNSDILGYAEMIGFYGMPLDYLNQFPEQISRVDKAAIDAMLKARFKPQQWLTVIVGQKDADDKQVDGKDTEQPVAAKAK